MQLQIRMGSMKYIRIGFTLLLFCHNGYTAEVATDGDSGPPLARKPSPSSPSAISPSVCAPQAKGDSPATQEQVDRLLKLARAEALADIDKRVKDEAPEEPRLGQRLAEYRHWLGVLSTYKFGGGRGARGTLLRQSDQDRVLNRSSQNLANILADYPLVETLSDSEREEIKRDFIKERATLPVKRTTSEVDAQALRTLKEKALNRVSELLRETPYLSFITKRVPGTADIAGAVKDYKRSLALRREHLTKMDLSSASAKQLALYDSTERVLKRDSSFVWGSTATRR
ncbi:MAG: hypothetical protein HC902_14610 [Calothrix sp. SM1_5_4]|nr:hypothetical protein [Calothrix sp. SM1_5_4]